MQVNLCFSWGNGLTRFCSITDILFSVCLLIWPINKFHYSHKYRHKQILGYIQPSFQKCCKSIISYRKIRVCWLIIYARFMQDIQLCSSSKKRPQSLLLQSYCLLGFRRPDLLKSSAEWKPQHALIISGSIRYTSRTLSFILQWMRNPEDIQKHCSKIRNSTSKLCPTSE